MTASNPMLHGSDLDECCSNVFALVSRSSSFDYEGSIPACHMLQCSVRL